MNPNAMKLYIQNTLMAASLLLLGACNNDNDNDADSPTDTVGVPTIAVDIGDSEVPYIIIDTDGTQIENEPKVGATMYVYSENELIKATPVGIEFRGSTSFRLSDKKSYGIETWTENGEDTDESFFGMPEEEDWILAGHIVNEQQGFITDRTLMYHYVGYNLYRDMGRYASRTQMVELQINDEYLGVYVFMEKLKRDNERIDIANLRPGEDSGEELTGGYILKIDKTDGGDLNLNQPLEYFLNNWDDDARYLESNSFRSRYDVFGNVINFDPYDAPYHSRMFLETYFNYEEPKADEITQAQKEYIQTYMDEFETALLNDDFSTEERTYTEYIDIPSFVDHFILNELVRNVDGYRLSTYLVKDKNEKLEMGPVWDLNIGYDTGDRIPFTDWVVNYNNYVIADPWMMPFWWPRLLEDPTFTSAIQARWSELRAGPLSTANIEQLVDDTKSYLVDNGAVERNYAKWNRVGVDYDASVESMKSFLRDRADWMDGEIAAF